MSYYVVKVKGSSQYLCDIPSRDVPQWYYLKDAVSFSTREEAIARRDAQRKWTKAEYSDDERVIIIAQRWSAADLREERLRLRAALKSVESCIESALTLADGGDLSKTDAIGALQIIGNTVDAALARRR